MSNQEKAIYPLSPREEGMLFILKNRHEGVVVTDSTKEAATQSTVDYFTSLDSDQLQDLNLHPDLVRQPRFIKGVLDIVQFDASFEKEQEHYRKYDENPYYLIDEVNELEEAFQL